MTLTVYRSNLRCMIDLELSRRIAAAEARAAEVTAKSPEFTAAAKERARVNETEAYLREKVERLGRERNLHIGEAAGERARARATAKATRQAELLAARAVLAREEQEAIDAADRAYHAAVKAVDQDLADARIALTRATQALNALDRPTATTTD